MNNALTQAQNDMIATVQSEMSADLLIPIGLAQPTY
jgi:hypothetical protein